MSAKRRPLDASMFATAAVGQPDPVAVAIAPRAEPPRLESLGVPAPKAKHSRAGKVQVQGYFSQATRRQLKMLAAQQGRTVEDVLGEAIADVLAKHSMG
jgi:hypothetical protein